MKQEKHPHESSDEKKASLIEGSYVPGRGLDRYSNSMKNLIPIRRKKREKGKMPVDNVGLFSFVTLSWFSKFMYKAYKGRLAMEELPPVSSFDSCNYNVDRLELLWEEELTRKGPEKASFGWVAWRFCRTRAIASSILFTMADGLVLLGPTLVMRKLLEYLQSGDGSYKEGVKWALLLTGVEFLRTLIFAWAWTLNCRTALRIRSACLTLVYRKIIRVNNLGNKGMGEVINLFANDAQRIFDMLLYGPMIFGGPMMTVSLISYILWFFSPIALLGMTAFLVFYPVQSMISRLHQYLQVKTLKISDKRVRLMNEILNCIKLIKMYAWEKRFSKDVLDTRKKEESVLLKTVYCHSFSTAMTLIVPVICAILTFLAHVSAGNNLTAAQAFPYLSILDMRFGFSLVYFRYGIEAILSAFISFDRIKGLLLLEESNCSIEKPILKSQAVSITDGTFACCTSGSQNQESPQMNGKNKLTESGDKREKEELTKLAEEARHVDILFDVSFEADKGKLVGVCGHVGSGKSSLLLAAMGQLRVSNGRVAKDGSCAYVSQEAWITNATLKENILFGAEFDPIRYRETIRACSLEQDLALLPGGDRTEIGEKGINLSGGQKQRVALARALYADRDIYFLDDPLSAVDARVGAYIFENLILGALAKKTVIFVTHQIHYLNRCDHIYVMRAGRIVEHGTHDDLMKMGDEYATMVTTIEAENEINAGETEDGKIIEKPVNGIALTKKPLSRTSSDSAQKITKSTEKLENQDQAGISLTVADNIEQGTIKSYTYHAYIVAAGGYFFTLIVILTSLVSIGSTAFSSWWLSLWIRAGGGVSDPEGFESRSRQLHRPGASDRFWDNATIVRNNVTVISENVNDNPDFWYYQMIYIGSIGFIVVSTLVRSLVCIKAAIRASTSLHNDLFKKIVGSPMRFFDTTPTGRIQHLFSRDMDEVDNRLPANLTNVMYMTFGLFFAMLGICVVLPWFILPLLVFTTVYYLFSKVFRVAVRDIRRMENQSRAPIFGFVTATIQGLGTIHAFGNEKQFVKQFSELFDNNSKCLYFSNVAIRWLAIRADGISVGITCITAFLLIVLQDQVAPAMAGLALSYAANMSGVFQNVTRVIAEAEVRFLSIEKIVQYLRALTTEGSTCQTVVNPPSTWPVVPIIEFKNVGMAYGDNTPLILKNVNFCIDGGEKIGIVGRTGSGKSSLTVALFRLVELAKGRISIDGVDISQVSLPQLRTKLSIIPQEPVLFSGTVRSNLDPFKLRTDAEIWRALEKTNLSDKFKSISGGLDASLGFDGDNLSVGERQLLCLSRALLRDSKILVLDEATAAVDPETELAVQNTIQREFSDCTVLTIAHRLQTVLSLDRVLVMDGGNVLEFDTPSNLLKDPDSEFAKMKAAVDETGSH